MAVSRIGHQRPGVGAPRLGEGCEVDEGRSSQNSSATTGLKYLPAVWAVVAGFVSLGIYVATTSRVVLSGDEAEFQTLAATGGIAHAGYPFLIMALRFFGGLPIG